jgi:splicing factor 3B subunit 4
VGNIDLKVTEEILWELFLQCGPVVSVQIPRDKITGDHNGYGFVEFKSEEDADYAIKIMHLIKLHGKPIKVNKASQDKRTQEVGANLFIGNLDPDVDEKTLFETFNSFGLILSTKIARDPETGASKGYGFVSYDSFESGDAAIASMDNQYFYNRMIKVSYAFKKESKGERHGDAAERLLAANRPLVTRPGFFGQSEGSAPISQRSLLLPPSLLSSHYSHLLSNENPAAKPSDQANKDDETGQPSSSTQQMAPFNSVTPKLKMMAVPGKEGISDHKHSMPPPPGTGKGRVIDIPLPPGVRPLSELPPLPPGLPPLPTGLPPLPTGLPQLPQGLPPLPPGMPPLPKGVLVKGIEGLPPLPPGMPPLPTGLPPLPPGMPPLPSNLPPLPPGMPPLPKGLPPLPPGIAPRPK